MNLLETFLILIITNIITTVTSYPKRILDNIIKTDDNLSISKYFQDFKESLQFSNETLSFKEDKSQSTKIFRNVSSNEYFISLPEFLANNTEVLDYYIDSIKKDGKLLESKRDYEVNTTYSENLIITDDKSMLNHPKNKENLLLDLHIFEPGIFSLFFKTTTITLTSHIVIDNLIIGIDENKLLKAYIFENGKFKSFDLNDKISETNVQPNFKTVNAFKQIVLDSNFDSSKRYIIITGDADVAYLFEVNYVNYEDIKTISFNIVLSFSDNLLSKNNIVDFVHENGFIYLAVEDTGIIVVEQVQTILHLTDFSNTLKIPLIVKDMQQIGNSIYIVIKDYGLKILNINENGRNLNFTDFDFKHPHLQKMEMHKNRNLDEFFLGILVSKKSFNEGHEFFFELSLKDHFHPTLHKIFLTNNYYEISSIFNDDRYTYLFEKGGNEMLVLSRSATATKYNSIFKVPIEHLKGKTVISDPIMFKDKKNKKTHIGFMTKDYFIYSEDFELTQGDLKINFYENGNYKIKLKAFADYCKDSKDISSKCYLTVDYYLKVNGVISQKLSDPLFSLAVVGFVVLNLITLFIYCKFYYKKKDVETIVKEETRQTDESSTREKGEYMQQMDERETSQIDDESNKVDIIE